MSDHISLTLGAIRKLNEYEKKLADEKYPTSNFRYVLLSEYKYINTIKNITITVPAGFLSDGSTGTPDWGKSWVFHDWLYCTHRFDNELVCTRKQADKLMSILIDIDHFHLLSKIMIKMARLNPFWIFSRSWNRSGERGAIFIGDLF